MAKFRITGRMTVDYSIRIDLEDEGSIESFRKDVALSPGSRASEKISDWVDPDQILNLGDIDYDVDCVEELKDGKFVEIT